VPRKRKSPPRPREMTVASRAVPHDLFPDGVVRFSVGASGKEGEARRTELRKLVTWRAWDVLYAVQAGTLDAGNVAARVKADGEAALAPLREKIGVVRGGSIPKLGDVRDRYLEWYERNRKDRSRIQVTSRLKRFLEQTPSGAPLEELPLDLLTRDQIERALASISAKAGTQNAVRAAVSGLYSWSIEEETEAARIENRPPRWATNPAAKVEQRETHARTVTASRQQVLDLLAAAEIHQRAYLRAFLHIGFRKDELVHSRLHLDLDTEDWVWRIQARDPDARCPCPQCSGQGWTPKVKRSHRTVHVPEQPHALRAAIAEYLEAYPCEPGDFVFRNPRTNGVWDEGVLSQDFKALCERAGVRYGRDVPGGLVIHDVRATCATELDKAGVSLKVIAALLGDSADTVMNKYLRVKPAEISDGISRGPDYSEEG
jgi:hypothetical protein